MDFVQTLLLLLVPLAFSVSFHEAAHAWMANRLGDPTARFMGRMTLNPIPHIDPFGTVILPLLLMITTGGHAFLAYAKPVPVNERNLRNPLRDGMLVAAAGPASNLILAGGFAILALALREVQQSAVALQNATLGGQYLLQMTELGVYLNVLLAFFNLLPIPPLDGARVVVGLFPRYAAYLRYVQRYGFLIIVLLWMSGLLRILVFKPSLVVASLLGVGP